MADGGLGEAFVEFSFGSDVLAWRSSGASGSSHHVDRVQTFYGHHLGLGFQEDVADLPAHFLVAPLGVAPCSLSVFGNSVPSTLAITWLARDVALVFALLVAASATALVVGTVA